MREALLTVAAKLHAELMHELNVDRPFGQMSALEKAKAELEFRRRLDKRLSAYNVPPDGVPGGRNEILLNVFKAFSRASHAIINRHDIDTVTARFQDAVREALQPKLF